LGTALVVGGLIAWGCSASDSNGGLGTGGGAAAGATGTGGIGGAGGVILDPDSGPPCETHCSADLHQVLDCNNVVVLECPPDQGCSPNGTCVPACQSASENESTFGCDFFSVTPAVIAESRGSCFAVMVANTWTSPITIGAEYNGQSIDTASYTYVPQGSGASLTYQQVPGGQLDPGQLGILFLSKYESGDIFQVDCPVAQALEMSTQVDTTGRGWAFHITTDRPIVAYDVYPWGGATSYVSSATLLVPTPTWGDNFVTADAWEALHGNPFTQVVAAEDNTTVTIVPITNVQGGGGIPAMTANTPTTFTLGRGEVVQFLQTERLAGSTLQSDKPISVWGGSSCMNIPNSAVCCDAAHQQLLPVQVLGSEYAAVRYPSRGGDDQAPYTLIGMVDGTQLWYDPMPGGAPQTVNRGDVAIFFTDQPFHVSSQDADHPFYLAAHMTGGSTSGNYTGDPEYVNVVPPQQYLSHYVFATDPTYVGPVGHTALVFVRQRDNDGAFQDVNLDCMGVVTGWQPLGLNTDYEYAQVLIVAGGQPQGGCDNGAHTADSPVPFGLTVWGYDECASYAYPAGMSVEPINEVVVPPIPR
jgi:hypothetical protein